MASHVLLENRGIFMSSHEESTSSMPLVTRASLDRTCDEFEMLLAQGGRPDLGTFLATAPHSNRRWLFCELLSLEVFYRLKAGEQPTQAEYLRRFPDQLAAIATVFAEAANGSPAAGRTGRPTTSSSRTRLPETRPESPIRSQTRKAMLVSLVALQHNLIEVDQLLLAVKSWAADKSQAMAEVLVSLGYVRADQLPQLICLVTEHLERYNGDSRIALSTLEVADLVRQKLDQSVTDIDVHATVVQLGMDRLAPIPPHPAAAAGAGPSSAGRFRILRFHRQGGLGQVSIAEDTELGRQVAFKEIQQPFAHSPEYRSRFIIEARITGNLEHPGIVPVYGLGQYPDGRPYYAMRWIQGECLTDALERFHGRRKASGGRPARRLLADPEQKLELRRLLERFMSVCETVEYAHSRGIIHRDIKPGNIMLGQYGETLVVDWGLAKTVEKDPEQSDEPAILPPQGAEGYAETQDGSAVGTPAYMSPEQAAGQLDLIGRATDVYSLGATLYALLTGRAPFDAPGSASAFQAVMSQIQKGDFPRPRQIEPGVPRPLEAICLKAMALSPIDRYESPKALAMDLEAWLADEPVSVYQERALERLARWSRLHRAWTQAGAAALVVIAVLAIAAVWIIDQQRDLAENQSRRAERLAGDKLRLAELADKARGEAETKRREAESEAANAQELANFLIHVLQGADVIGLQVHDSDGVVVLPVAAGERTLKEVLDEAEQQLSRGPDVKPQSKALLMHTIGTVYRNLGQFDKAERWLREAQAIRYSHLGPDHLHTLQTELLLAWTLADAGKLDEANLFLRHVLAQRKNAPPGDLIRSTAEWGLWATALAGNRSEAEAIAQIAEELEDEWPDESKRLLMEAFKKHQLAMAARHTRRFEQAETLSREVLDVAQRQLGPQHPLTALLHGFLAGVLKDKGDYRGADAEFRQALALGQRALGANPKMVEPMVDWIQSRIERGSFQEADKWWQRAASVVERHMPPGDYRGRRLYKLRPEILEGLGQYEELDFFCRDHLRKHANLLPADDVRHFQWHRAVALQSKGEYERAAAIYRTLLAENRPAGELRRLAQCLRDAGSYDEAHGLETEAQAKDGLPTTREPAAARADPPVVLALLQRLERTVPKSLDVLRSDYESHRAEYSPTHPIALVRLRELGLRQLQEGQVEESRRSLEQVLAARRKVLPDDDPFISQAMVDLALVRLAAGDHPGAISLALEALDSRRRCFGQDHLFLAQTLQEVGLIHFALEMIPEAQHYLNEALAICLRLLPDLHPAARQSVIDLADVLAAARSYGRLEQLLTGELRLVREIRPAGSWRAAELESHLGGCLAAQQRYAEAEELLLNAYDVLQRSHGPRHELTRQTIARLVQLYAAQQHQEKVQKYRAMLE
jgi:serine/threonine protein kinase